MGRLYWKFFAFILLAQLLGIVGTGASFWLRDLTRSNANEFNRSPPAGFMMASVDATLAHGGPEAMRSLLAAMKDDRFAVYAVNQAGAELLARPVSPDMLEHAQGLAGKGDSAARWLTDAAGRRYLLFVPQVLHGGMHHGPGPDRAFSGNGHPGDLPLRPMIAALLVSLVAAAVLARHIAQPVRQLRQAFDDAADGKLDQHLAGRMGRRRDEMAQLAQDFDRMTERLRLLMDGERKLLHDVSHELRSPLARLQAAIGLTRQQPARSAQMLERIERESMRMDQLVGEILTLSRLESAIALPPHAQAAVDIDALLTEITEDAAFELGQQDRMAHYTGAGPCIVSGNRDLLRRAVENVVRNALRFSAEGTPVRISAQVDAAQMLLVSVCDRGPGVPDGELDHIFAPFYRAAAGGEAGGYGLGLAIARRVVESHGGTIRARNRDGGGLCVDMVLPLAMSGNEDG